MVPLARWSLCRLPSPRPALLPSTRAQGTTWHPAGAPAPPPMHQERANSLPACGRRQHRLRRSASPVRLQGRRLPLGSRPYPIAAHAGGASGVNLGPFAEPAATLASVLSHRDGSRSMPIPVESAKKTNILCASPGTQPRQACQPPRVLVDLAHPGHAARRRQWRAGHRPQDISAYAGYDGPSGGATVRQSAIGLIGVLLIARGSGLRRGRGGSGYVNRQRGPNWQSGSLSDGRGGSRCDAHCHLYCWGDAHAAGLHPPRCP